MRYLSRMIRGKRASYIVEAAIVMPAFILAVLAMIHLIPVIESCENISYDVAEEMRLEMGKAAFRPISPAFPLLAKARVKKNNAGISSFRITSYRPGYTSHGCSDLISLSFRCVLEQPDPLSAYQKVRFSGRIKARAFTGSYYSEADSGGARVCVFPDRGECYHSRYCTAVISNCRQVFLTNSIKEHYTACPNCHSGKLALGSPVYCFDEYGEAYHRGHCAAVSRYYLVISKKEAIDSGYKPCSKCGGG